MTVGIVSTYTINSISPLHSFFHIFPVEYRCPITGTTYWYFCVRYYFNSFPLSITKLFCTMIYKNVNVKYDVNVSYCTRKKDYHINFCQIKHIMYCNASLCANSMVLVFSKHDTLLYVTS
jgi:hypothetical protein